MFKVKESCKTNRSFFGSDPNLYSPVPSASLYKIFQKNFVI